MDLQVIEHEFSTRTGQTVYLWAVYHQARLFSMSFAVSPLCLMETVDFNVSKRSLNQ